MKENSVLVLALSRCAMVRLGLEAASSPHWMATFEAPDRLCSLFEKAKNLSNLRKVNLVNRKQKNYKPSNRPSPSDSGEGNSCALKVQELHPSPE